MSDLVEVLLPSDQAEGTRSQVLAWLKAVGDRVNENEPLLEIETDKVTVEIPAPCAGTLREILLEAQAEVEPGAVLGRIDRNAQAATEATSAPSTAAGPIRNGAGSVSPPPADTRASGQLSPGTATAG